MFGVGSVIGPIISGGLMSILPSQGLFITTLMAHLLILTYGLWRINQNEAVSDEDKTDFVGMAPGRYTTPETSALDPRSIEESVPGPR